VLLWAREPDLASETGPEQAQAQEPEKERVRALEQEQALRQL
jgi:hypothetical protein